MAVAELAAPETSGAEKTRSEEIMRLVSQLAQGRIATLKIARETAVRYALAQAQGNVSQAAELLGISRGTIYRYSRS